MAVKHGGNLLAIARQYQTDATRWIDLSTGVSPFTYPVGEIPISAWNQLPQTDDGLEQIAKSYYNGPVEPIAVSGSQAAIMALPSLLTDFLGKCGTVALPKVGYKEHEQAWRSFQKDGDSWSIRFYDDAPSQLDVSSSDVIVVINPNNPTGVSLNSDYLMELADDLSRQSGVLIIDEAFADAHVQESVLSPTVSLDNLVVLRSVGKFFGLAGARVGFVFANQQISSLLQEYLGPWTVAGPSRWVIKQALVDTHWHKKTKAKIEIESARLKQLLSQYLPFPMAGTSLFTTLYCDDAKRLHVLLCEEQIFTRLCDEKNAIRLGLPANESQWQKLESALIKLSQNKRVSL